jgi:ribonuclease E
MPLAGAFASPELASGKVCLGYPVAQSALTKETKVNANAHQTTQDKVLTSAEVTVSVTEDVIEPQTINVEKTTSGVVVASIVQSTNLAVIVTEVASSVAGGVEVLTSEPTIASKKAPAETETPLMQKAVVPVTAKPDLALQQEPSVQEPPVKVVPNTSTRQHITSASMTKATALAYLPEKRKHSDWQRHAFGLYRRSYCCWGCGS